MNDSTFGVINHHVGRNVSLCLFEKLQSRRISSFYILSHSFAVLYTSSWRPNLLVKNLCAISKAARYWFPATKAS